MWLQGCRDLHVHHWKFPEDSPWYLIILQSFPLPIISLSCLGFESHSDTIRYFPRRPLWIKQTNYFLKTLFIKEPSCSFEGGETTDHWILIIRSHGTIIVRNHDLSLSVEGKYYTSAGAWATWWNFHYYRPQRSCEGYVLTGVCLSIGGGEGGDVSQDALQVTQPTSNI